MATITLTLPEADKARVVETVNRMNNETKYGKVSIASFARKAIMESVEKG